MGLLDDAIREHLDLKRRRGADPTEVEREEREVLGPVRPRVQALSDDEHEPEFGREDELEHEPLALDSDPWDDEQAEALADPHPRSPAATFDHEGIGTLEPETDSYARSQLEPAPFEPVEREPAPFEPVQPAPAPFEPVEPVPAPFEPVAPVPAPEPYRADADSEPPDTGEPTVEYSLEDAIEEDETPPKTGDEEDVLEETPDFLQDTPDHDRLWFEQRPPRDFDFDG
jgi:hypothetical protein